MEKINILWTGGYDSSFAVCYLSLLPVDIQPIYISLGRKSEPNELKAMADISEYINQNKNKRCRLSPLKVFREEDIEKNEQITNSYLAIHKDHAIGYQQDRIARLAHQLGTKLVQGIEDGPNGTGNVSTAIGRYARIVEGSISLGGGEKVEFCELDASESSREILDIFGGIRFLLPLYYRTKIETLELFKQIAYEEVIPMTWFCAQPIKGKPCGLCNPCASTYKAGMGFRLPLRARIFYQLFKKNAIGNYFFIKIRLLYYKLR